MNSESWHVVFVDEEGEVIQVRRQTLKGAYSNAVSAVLPGDIKRPFIYYGTRRPDKALAA